MIKNGLLNTRIMKTNKEYPATHSMATAWYCVDEDGNVGIFDIEDNGPVPEDGYNQTDVNDVFLEDFSVDSELGLKVLNLSPEQVLPMLEPSEDLGEWVKSGYGDGLENVAWMNALVKIDMSKLDIFIKAASKDNYPLFKPVCLSKELGLFYADFFSNKEGIDLLEKNHVIIEKYKPLYYDTPYDENDEEEQKRLGDMNRRYPFYIYLQDYWPFARAARKLNQPQSPMKINQLPIDIQNKIFRLPLRFKDTETIQLAEFMPVSVSGCPEYVYDGNLWSLLKLSDGNCGYYCEKNHNIIPESEFKVYLDEGKAEEYDWDKHHELKK